MFDDPIKAEIWAMVNAMNDAWIKGEPDRLVNYFHADMVAVTPVARHRLDGGPACVEGWKSFVEKTTEIYYMRIIYPVIHVYGDAAVVAYDYDIAFDVGGEEFKALGRDLLYVAKENGRWWVVADQYSPYPS